MYLSITLRIAFDADDGLIRVRSPFVLPSLVGDLLKEDKLQKQPKLPP